MIELTIILVLLVFNGVFAMAEIAIVSARKARLQQMAKSGSKGAALALRLAENPERFLSTVQIGITLVGVLAGAFGGASLSGYLVPVIEQIPGLADSAAQIAFALVVAFITYLSLIIGELVPKNLALRNPEAIAAGMAGMMSGLSKGAAPLVWMLEFSTRTVMRLFGKASAPNGPTPDEVKVLVREGMVTGGVRSEESDMLEGVFDLRELHAEEVMRPKPRVTFLHVDDDLRTAAEKLQNSREQVFPVYERSRDHVVGLVSVRDLFLHTVRGGAQTVGQIMHEPRFVPDNQPALTLIKELQKAPLGAAVVADEFGIVRGLVTMEDIVEEVIGDLSPVPAHVQTHLRELEPGLWVADGMAEIDDVAEAIPDLHGVIEAAEENFQTVAGFILHHLERLPREGEQFEAGGFRFDILDMDHQRIDKVSIRRLAVPPEQADAGLAQN